MSGNEMHHRGYDLRLAMEEASRCLLCYDAPCSKACPADTKPDEFIRAIRFKNIKGAAEIIRNANVCGGSCAVVCPAGKLCEGVCLRKEIDRPIAIRKLQQFAVEQEIRHGLNILEKITLANAKRVACIGAGPASLACAAKLAQNGYQVDIFEAQSKAGGMLSYGIPANRLSQKIVDWDIKTVTDLGVKIHYNQQVGKDISFQELKNNFSAVFIGCGLWQGNSLGVSGAHLNGVMEAIDYLSAARKNNLVSNKNKNVVVIGAGDTAMDCVMTAKNQGAENVTILYRNRIEKAPAYIEELQAVQNAGIVIFPQFKLVSINGRDKVESIDAIHLDNLSTLHLQTDLVITAISQQLTAEIGNWISVKNSKQIETTANYTTVEPGIFVAGDAANGGSTVVQAVFEGKEAAEAIIKYLADGE